MASNWLCLLIVLKSKNILFLCSRLSAVEWVMRLYCPVNISTAARWRRRQIVSCLIHSSLWLATSLSGLRRSAHSGQKFWHSISVCCQLGHWSIAWCTSIVTFSEFLLVYFWTHKYLSWWQWQQFLHPRYRFCYQNSNIDSKMMDRMGNVLSAIEAEAVWNFITDWLLQSGTWNSCTKLSAHHWHDGLMCVCLCYLVHSCCRSTLVCCYSLRWQWTVSVLFSTC